MIKGFWKLKWWQKALVPLWPVFYVFYLAKYALGALWLYKVFIWQVFFVAKNSANLIYRRKSEAER